MMKTQKHTISLIILCLVLLHVNKSIGQTQVTRYTPLGSPVIAYNDIPGMSSGDQEDWSDQVSITYPNATELKPPSATTSYNCHAYAWHVSEGGDRVWIGYYQGQQDHEDIYWEDGSYIRLNSESGADKISYYEDNHSAIQTSTQGSYISKWGEGPLMQHARDYGPSTYLMNYRKYYDEPAISGDKVLCYLSTKTYSVQDFHNVTYSWSTSPNLQINGSITGRSVSVSPTSSANGSGYVKVTIDIQDNNETRVMSKNVWVGSPTINASDMIFTNTFGDSEYLCTSHYGNEVSWSYSYPYDYWDVRVSNSNGTQVLYTQRLYNSTSANLDYTSLSPGFYLVGVRGTNECGTGAWNDTEVMWSDCSQDGEGGDIYSLELTPNPVTNESEIEVFRNDGKTIEDDIIWEVEVYDFDMNLKSKPNKIYGNKHKIKAHSWKKGIYIVRAYIDDEIIIKKFMKK